VAGNVVEKEVPRRALKEARGVMSILIQRVDTHIEAPDVVPDLLEGILDAVACRSEAVDVTREALQANAPSTYLPMT
jgi:hypothetical protein